MLNTAEIPNLVQLDVKLPRLVSKLLEVMPAKYSLLIFKLGIGMVCCSLTFPLCNAMQGHPAACRADKMRERSARFFSI